MQYLDCDFYCVGENVNELFTRSTALAFDQAILREVEETDLIGSKSKQQIGEPAISKS